MRKPLSLAPGTKGREMKLSEQMIVGDSLAMLNLRSRLRQVKNTDLNIFICGETGTGKDLIAKTLHFMSHRRHKPFIKVNCAVAPSEILESELFGYEMAAFGGVDSAKIGQLELAHGGTILLDKIDAVPLTLQVKLLQVLQDFQFSRPGGKSKVKVDCWVLVATSRNLESRINEGRFRKDLYHRLNIIRMFIPPLRERSEDIEPLAHHFAEQFSSEAKRPPFRFSHNPVMDVLRQYSWPGNVRELKNAVKRLVLQNDWVAVKEELGHGGRRVQDQRAVGSEKPEGFRE
jgi:DNA-binding NtrC family response regulator